MADEATVSGVKLVEEEERQNDEKNMSRKERRKARKKQKRKLTRRELAEMEKKEEEAALNDPEEQKRMLVMEEEERARMDSERKEFEQREKDWIEAMERKKRIQEEEEENRRKDIEEEAEYKKLHVVDMLDEDDDWEYVEEGPAEIIWQGNEIIVRKKKVKVPKKEARLRQMKENAERPTSNPLPPQSEVFSEYQNASAVSAEQALANVAQQVPNFGTEQDKAHCPFHMKTGACRFGQRCSRVHFYPDKSCTLLIKNMYNGPGLAWEQDEGLEYTDEEVECCYDEFYEDVHTEFLKFGEIVNFKVCRNGSFHLRGNVYVHYKSLDAAVLAYHSANGRYFAGKQVMCEFINVTRWKVAICGEYMKSRLKTCSRGTACNFIHCFRNPGGDYEWADWDKAPPRYWVQKMTTLFGYCDESGDERTAGLEHLGTLSSTKISTADSDSRSRPRSSRSREVDWHSDQENSCHPKHTNNHRRRLKYSDKKVWEKNSSFEEDHHEETKIYKTSPGGFLDRYIGRDRIKSNDIQNGYGKNKSENQCNIDSRGTYVSGSSMHSADSESEVSRYHHHTRSSTKQDDGASFVDNEEYRSNRISEADISELGRDRYRERNRSPSKKRTQHRSKSKAHTPDSSTGSKPHFPQRRKSQPRKKSYESPNCRQRQNMESEDDLLDSIEQRHHGHKSKYKHQKHNEDDGDFLTKSRCINIQDRWDPETSVAERNTEKEADRSNRDECCSPGRYGGRT